MKVSTEISSAARLVGEEKAIELCAKAGFDGWDFSMFKMRTYHWPTGTWLDSGHPLGKPTYQQFYDWNKSAWVPKEEIGTPEYLRFARQLKEVADDNGIVCNQSHAPFPTKGLGFMDYLKRAIECTAEVGGKIIIIHPDNDKTPEGNAEIYTELMPFAKGHGVKIATENMYNWKPELDQAGFAACATAESFVAHLNAVNDEDFVACLDLGHAEMKPAGDGAVKMIHALGDKLQALHIHDTDCRHDNHQIPFSLNQDFAAMAKALKAIGYKGWFTLEADSYLGKFTAETALDGLKDLHAAVRKFAAMFEEA